MSQNEIPLASIFQAVAKTLAENQGALNQADEANQNHGDHMVHTFKTIARSMQVKKGSSNSEALQYAAKQLGKSTQSNSGQLYAKGLAQAASQVAGKEVNTQAAMQILQALISGGQAPQQPAQSTGGDLLSTLLGSQAGGETSQSASGELLGTLLGNLTGSQQSQPQQDSQDGSGMLGDLLGALTGSGNANSGTDKGLDAGDLLNAGMAFMQSRQSGKSNQEALLQAFLSASGMGGSAHRAKSTQLVVNTFLQALASAGK
jgi:hypothetical protein